MTLEKTPPRRLAQLSPQTLQAMFDARVGEDPGHPYLRWQGRTLTIGEVAEAVHRFANGLLAQRLKRGDRVAVMLPNTPDYVVAFLAMVRLGICQVPLNIHLRGDALAYQVTHSKPRALIVDARYAPQLQPVLKPGTLEVLIVRDGGIDAGFCRQVAFETLRAHADASRPAVTTRQEDTVLIGYTSGTTGAPKGVLVSDKMLQAAAWAAGWLGDARPGDVLHFWEPIYHIGGSQVVVLAVMERITLAMVERFSVSNLLDEVIAEGCTHLHFLGGVVGLLLKQPPSAKDRDHRLRLAFGGGCPKSMWREFEERFGIPIFECYGMTEAASFTTVNREGRLGSVGKPLPYFEVKIADGEGRALPPEERGEFWVREREPNLIMKGYFDNPTATSATLIDGWLHTGDVGYTDADGFFYYAGRMKDSLRRRGENISAWEVERVFADHPAIAECAVIGVANEIDDQDLKLFVRLNPEAKIDPLDLVKWAEPRMPRFQIPRFIAMIDAFPKTPSERIRKELLPKTTDSCWDLERSGYQLRR